MTTNSNDYRHALEHISFTDNAKQHMATAVKMETQFPYVLVKPLMVSSAPAAAP